LIPATFTTTNQPQTTFFFNQQKPTHDNITMAAEYQGQDPMVIAKQAERDLNSQKAPLSDSSKSSPPPKKVHHPNKNKN
jgi:hypothetical protein